MLPPYAWECWATLLGDVRAAPVHYRMLACVNTSPPSFTASSLPSATACVPWPSVLWRMQSKPTPPGFGTHRKSTHKDQELNQKVGKVGPWNSPLPWSQHYVHHTGAPPRDVVHQSFRSVHPPLKLFPTEWQNQVPVHTNPKTWLTP
jgi:hypothetical protein